MISDFPDYLQIYVKNHGLDYEGGINYWGWVFWSPEKDDSCERPPPAPSSDVSNSEFMKNVKLFLKSRALMLTEPALVQFWKAIEIGGKRVLTTQHQPFGLITFNEGLCRYRMISLDYEFSVDEEGSEEHLGLPGRVFRHQQSESTPNVGYYSCNEYPLRDRAVDCGITGSWAFPMFGPSGCCIGVLEAVTTSEITKSFNIQGYELYCRRQQGGDLRSRKCHHYEKDYDEALQEEWNILQKILQEVCTTHFLPSAQTWVWCKHCNHLVIDDTPCYGKVDMHPFFDMCVLRDLRNGQGVVGKAFSSHNLAFCKDITQFSLTDHPLAHYARKYGLKGTFAICLQSSSTGDNFYVLEFFLPPSNTEGGDPKITLDPILATMKQHLHHLTVASGKELGEELPIDVIDFSKDGKLNSFQIPQIARSRDRTENGEEEVWPVSLDQQLPEVDVIDSGNNVVSNTEKNNIAAVTSLQQECTTNLPPRQKRKAGIPISLEDLQQCSDMKLDDAAKRLGVSRSTVKRNCRKNNIAWWQRCKRNKDNHSLPNELVQGAVQEQIRESSQPPNSNPPYEKNTATASCTKPHSMPVQGTSIVTIKAKYGDDFIIFHLPVSSGMAEFQQEVAKRLNLKGGTYCVKYQDDDKDWILIACDEDLQNYICDSISLGRNTITMSITNCPP